jgi:hypothetical protein
MLTLGIRAPFAGIAVHLCDFVAVAPACWRIGTWRVPASTPNRASSSAFYLITDCRGTLSLGAGYAIASD